MNTRRTRMWGTTVKATSLLTLVALAVSLAAPVRAAGKPVNYAYTSIDYPGAIITFAFGLNDAGPQVVGAYVDPDFTVHGWLLSGGTLSTLDFPGAGFSENNDINNRGEILGEFLDAADHEHGFLLAGGAFTVVDFPGASDTETDGINDAGDIVGGYGPGVGAIFQHGFLLSHGAFTSIDVPGAVATWTASINNRGQIAGTYLDAAGIHHGFLLSRGTFTTIDFPGAVHTILFGSNNKGEIVGRYVTDPNVFRSSAQHAFLYSFGQFYNVDPPGWTGRAIASGINNQGQIVGLFRDPLGRHGFLATPARGP